jgi:hypothetical protein
VRLIIVADRLPAGVVRIIEFLNEQMRPAEFLGVEVAQHVGADSQHIVYVPRLRGQTTKAQDTKGPAGTRRRWDRDTYLAEASVRNQQHPDALKLIGKLVDDAEQLAWESGGEPGVGGWYVVGGERTGVWELYAGSGPPTGQPSLTIALSRIAARLGDDRTSAVVSQLEQIPAFNSAVSMWRTTPSRQPNGKLGQLGSNAQEITSLFSIIHDVVDHPKVASS